VDIAPHYGLLSVQGPRAHEVVRDVAPGGVLPEDPLGSIKVQDADIGEWHLMNQPRLGSHGFDVFAPVSHLRLMAIKLRDAVMTQGGKMCGWSALDAARVGAGVPRFGVDMDETNLPQETGLEARAVSYNKGCYIGQEVINRIHSIGRVNKTLTRFEFLIDTPCPARGDRIVSDGRDAGYVTSAVRLPDGRQLGLGYLQRDARTADRPLLVKTPTADVPVRVLKLTTS
jgi:folate-binding protein YgfZ